MSVLVATLRWEKNEIKLKIKPLPSRTLPRRERGSRRGGHGGEGTGSALALVGERRRRGLYLADGCSY